MKIQLFFVSFLTLALAGCDSQGTSNTSGANARAGHEVASGTAGHAMGDQHPHHEGAATMKLALSPTSRFTPGKPRTVTLTLTDLASGTPIGVDDLAVAHTQKMHLLVVDASLTDYQHIHPLPEPSKAGTWRFDFAPRFGRTYKVWADVTRPDGHQEYVGADLSAGNEHPPKPSAALITKAEADGLTFALSFPGPLKVGQAAAGSIAIIDSKTNKPFGGLQPIMGAFRHIVAFAGDWDSIEHVHPLGAEPKLDSERSGPVIRFHIQPEQAGILKLFAQIRANGRETIVPFTVAVAP